MIKQLNNTFESNNSREKVFHRDIKTAGDGLPPVKNSQMLQALLGLRLRNLIIAYSLAAF